MTRIVASSAKSVSATRTSPRKRKLVSLESDDILEHEASKQNAAPIASPSKSRTSAVKKSAQKQTLQPSSVPQTAKVESNGVSEPKLSTPRKKISTAKPKVEQEIDVPKPPEIITSSLTADNSPKREIKSDDLEGAKVVKKRKTKQEKEADAMPLAARSVGLKMYVGAHVSIAKGVENAVTNAVHIGGNAFALFLKSQRKWENPPLKSENRDAFHKACADHKYDASSYVVPHGSYLVNLATPDKEKAKQAYDAFVDDLHRCEALGIKYYNFHPGSTNQEPLEEAIGRISSNLNRALTETKTVVPLLENMAGRGSVIGSRFSDLRDIIAGIMPEFRSRVGICIDTCHAFAAGYDLRSPQAFKNTLQELDQVVGLKYLKAMHINDSKAPFGSHRDLHQNIGVGFLGLRAFHNVMNEPRLQNIPLVLETPCDRPDPKDSTGKKTIDDKNVWSREIKMLESLIGMDPESAEFKTLEKELSERGRAEREKMEISIAATEAKKQKKLEKGQKSISDLFGSKSAANKGEKGKSKSDSELSDLEE